MSLLRPIITRPGIQICLHLMRKQDIKTLAGLSYVQMKHLKSSTTTLFQRNSRVLSSSGRSYCNNTNGSNGTSKKRTEISYGELLDLLDSGEIQLFDVREPKELEEKGYIPGCTNLPLTKLKCALASEAEEFEGLYGVSKPSKTDTNIVFYGLCEIKGSTAVQIAQKGGYKHARHYPGGFDEWNHKQKATG